VAILVILPTGTYRAEEYLAAARRLSVEVVSASEAPQALAEKMEHHFLRLPLEDPKTAASLVVEHARAIPLEAVLAVDDEGLLTAALAAEALGLPHSPPGAVRLTRDKAAMRRTLARAGVAQPDFVVVAPGDREGIEHALNSLGAPVVVKPTGLSASRGVIRADSLREALHAAAWAEAIASEAGEPAGTPLVIESFVSGPEFAVEGVLSSGSLEVVTVFDKPDPLDGPYFEETIYLAPTALPPGDEEALLEATRKAVAAIGLTEGPVHAEVRIEAASGRPLVIEVAGRTIGGRCSKALELEGGASLEELVISRYLRRTEPPARLSHPAGVLMIPIPSSGRLVEVGNQDEVRALEHVTGVEVTVPAGRLIRQLPEGDRYLGFVFAAARERHEVETALRRAGELLEVVVDQSAVRPAGTVA
jgi:biotin carboxylase